MAMFAIRHRQGSPASRRTLRSVVGPENPIAVLTVYTAMAVMVLVEAATSAIGPGQPVFPGFMWILGAIVGGVWHLLAKRSLEGLQERAFLFSLAGATIGMIARRCGGCCAAVQYWFIPSADSPTRPTSPVDHAWSATHSTSS